MKKKTNNELNEFKKNIKIFNGYEKNVEDSSEVYYNVRKNIEKIQPFERPDLYIELEDKVIGIEQFEFSAYDVSKKGDSIKRKLDEIDKDNQKEFWINGGNDYFITEVETNISRNNYENNFIKAFEKHYKNIPEYKDNLQVFNKEVEIYFLIADETVEGTGINLDGNYEFYVPIMNKNILLYLKDHLDVKGIIFQCSCVFNNKLFYYLKNVPENIDKLLIENKKYFDKELVKENFRRINSFWRFDDYDE